MRARNLISFGIAATVAVACSNPSSESANDPAVDLLSELEPALLLPAASSDGAVLSAAELTPADAGPTAAATAPRPRETPAHVAHTAHVDEVRPQVVQTVASIPSEETFIASAAGISGDEDAGHDHADGPSTPGIMIRGGVDIGIRGDPCIPGGHRPEQGPGVGGIIGGIADASMLGAAGTMVNDQTPRIGQGNLPYPRNDRGSTSRGGTSIGGMGGGAMGGGGRVFIR